MKGTKAKPKGKPMGSKGGKSGKGKPCRFAAVVALVAALVALGLGADAQAGWVYIDEPVVYRPVVNYGFAPLLQVGPLNVSYRYRFRTPYVLYAERVNYRAY